MTPEEYTAAKASIAEADARIAEIDADLTNTRKLYAERESVLEESKPLRESVNEHEQALRQAEKEARDAAREAAKLPPEPPTPEEYKAKLEADLAQAEADVATFKLAIERLEK
jgi:chromosome segregation ATPase